MTLSQPQCSNGASQSRPFPARPVKIMESAGHIHEQAGCAAQPISALEREKVPAGANAQSLVDGHAARFHWHQVAAKVRSELVRADFTERQFRVAEFMVSATLERGRQSVKGINLEELGAVLGISKGNVSEVFTELQFCWFLQVIESPDCGKIYRVMPASELWQVKWRYERARLEGYLQALDVATGHAQVELFEPEPDLKAAIAETQLENSKLQTPNFRESLNSKIQSDGGAARFSVKSGQSWESKSTLSFLRNLESTKSKTTESVQVSTNVVKSIRITDEAVNRTGVVGGDIHTPAGLHSVPKLGTQVLQAGRVWERMEVAARNWAEDEDVVKYLGRCSRLKVELWDGKTTLAQLFCGLYAQRRQVAVELLGTAVTLDRANAFLNEAVLEEFGLRQRKTAKA